jgi:hypothetical protein
MSSETTISATEESTLLAPNFKTDISPNPHKDADILFTSQMSNSTLNVNNPDKDIVGQPSIQSEVPKSLQTQNIGVKFGNKSPHKELDIPVYSFFQYPFLVMQGHRKGIG